MWTYIDCGTTIFLDNSVTSDFSSFHMNLNQQKYEQNLHQKSLKLGLPKDFSTYIAVIIYSTRLFARLCHIQPFRKNHFSFGKKVHMCRMALTQLP